MKEKQQINKLEEFKARYHISLVNKHLLGANYMVELKARVLSSVQFNIPQRHQIRL